MGHSSVVITRDRYGHVRPDRVAQVREVLDAYERARLPGLDTSADAL
jgi:hypothetical protein